MLTTPTETGAAVSPAAVAFAENALLFEARAGDIVKNPDTPENFKACYQVMTPALVEAGKSFAQHSNVGLCMARDHAEHRALSGQPLRVAFYLPSTAMLAHAVNLQTFLRGLKMLAVPCKSDPLGITPIEPYIYTHGEPNETFEAAFRGIKRNDVRYCAADTFLRTWLKTREQCWADEIDVFVHVSVVQGMAFAATAGIAPYHVWWAHKWHGLEIPDLGGYIDACHPFHKEIDIDGRRWPCTYTALPELLDGSKTAEAVEARKQFGDAIVFGWMGREVKLTPAYAEAVIRILRAVPNSRYVFTGRDMPNGFGQQLIDGGVADRCMYIGWVDTRLWAQIIDIYLDTFPFQSGHSAYETMAASRPVIWLHNPDQAEEQSASGLLHTIWHRSVDDRHYLHSCYGYTPWCNTVDEYVNRAIAMAKEPTSRKRFGAGGRMFIDRYMRNEAAMAASFVEVLNGVIHGHRSDR